MKSSCLALLSALLMTNLAFAEQYRCSYPNVGIGATKVYQSIPTCIVQTSSAVGGIQVAISRSCAVISSSALISSDPMTSGAGFYSQGTLSCTDGRVIGTCNELGRYAPAPTCRPISPIACYPNHLLNSYCKTTGSLNIPNCPCAADRQWGCIPIVPEGGSAGQVTWSPVGGPNVPGTHPLPACEPILESGTSNMTPPSGSQTYQTSGTSNMTAPSGSQTYQTSGTSNMTAPPGSQTYQTSGMSSTTPPSGYSY